MTAVSLPDAARQLGKCEATLKNWIRQGCPVVRPARQGRGNGALVDIEAVMAWRQGLNPTPDRGIGVLALAGLLLDFYRRESGAWGLPAHTVLGISDRDTALLLACLWQYVAKNSQYSLIFPQQLRQLLDLAGVESD